MGTHNRPLAVRSICILAFVYVIGCDKQPLDRKLEAQFAQFEKARTSLAEYSAINEQPLDHDWWLDQIDPGRAYRLTEKDVEELQASQKARIDKAREASNASSMLDLDRIRAEGKVREFCEQLPKGGMLHVHPNGTLDEATVARLLEATNPELDRKDLNQEVFALCLASGRDELKAIKDPLDSRHYNDLSEADKAAFRELYFFPEGEHNLLRFMFTFDLVSLLRDAQGVDVWKEIYEDFFKRCQKKGVMYVEFSKGYKDSDPDGLERISRMAELGLQYGVVARWNFSFSRSRDIEKNFKRLKELLDEPSSPQIRGIDLIGPEEKYPGFEAGHLLYGYVEAKRRMHATDMKRTIHAAELGRPGNFRDALIFGVERIGHGARAHEDPLAMEYASHLRPGLEVNLVSNIRLDYHNDYKTHPFLDLLRLGVKASLSTDDEGILRTNIAREFELAIVNTDITYDELKQLARNSLGTAFVEDDIRDKLLLALETEFKEFEARWAAYARPGVTVTVQ